MTADIPPPPADPSAGIVRYVDTMHDDILAFQPRAYPKRRRDWIQARWDWMFLASAARVGSDPMVWAYRDAAGVQAQRGAIMVRLQCGTTDTVAGWLVDTAVLSHLRGRGIGDALVARATRDVPVGLSLGQTPQIRAFQDRHGWRPVATMRSWFVVLRPQEAFRGRVRQPLVRAGVAWAGAVWRVACAAAMPRVGRDDVRHVDRFDHAHDRLWERVRARFECLVVRDASYLNWKYVDQPGTAPRRVSVVDASGEVRGVCIWTRHAADGTHGYARGWILDLIVDPAVTGDVHAVLAAVIEDARAESVDVLEFDVLAPALAPFLRRTGWIRGGVTRHLRVGVHGVEGDLAARLARAESWFLTRGDSDGDHPWWTPAGREPDTTAA